MWLTTIDRQELGDAAPGTAASRVNEAIWAGTPVHVQPSSDGEARGFQRTRRLWMVFNPGNVIGVAEQDRGRRPL